MDCLAALLLDGSQVFQVPLRFKPNFLAKFTLRGREQFFALFRFAFGYAPSTCIFVLPQGTTRVDQQHFKSSILPLENHNSRASLGH